jgi:hypothetical protein
MPNLELIKTLNRKYDKVSPFTSSLKNFSLNESINFENIEFAVQDNIKSLGTNYINYFLRGQSTNVVLLFIDICNFSTRYSDLTSSEISDFFDDYYDIVIPIIYKFGGEIDKIIGDGIICIFGEPFLNLPLNECIKKADMCSKEIIELTTDINMYSSKIAFHFGEIKYFINKSGFYNEITVVGKPLTELFRLESISEDLRINYFVDYNYLPNWNKRINEDSCFWVLEDIKQIPSILKGVSYSYYQTNKYSTKDFINRLKFNL